jgi:hypothetical protein
VCVGLRGGVAAANGPTSAPSDAPHSRGFMAKIITAATTGRSGSPPPAAPAHSTQTQTAPASGNNNKRVHYLLACFKTTTRLELLPPVPPARGRSSRPPIGLAPIDYH